jgi:hypothetical protein
MPNIEVQDPAVPTDQKCESFKRCLGPSSHANFAKSPKAGRTVGYGGDEIPPYNLQSLPSFCPSEPSCLLTTEATRIHHLLHAVNHAPGSPAPAKTSWSILGTHLAITLSHQDHDGHGTLLQWHVWLQNIESHICREPRPARGREKST